MLKKKEVKHHHHSQLSKSAREIKAKILKELAAEKALEGPHVSDEPTFTKVEEAYERFGEVDITCETIPTTVGRIQVFLEGVFHDLIVESLDTLTKSSVEGDTHHQLHHTRTPLAASNSDGNSSGTIVGSVSPGKTKLPTLGRSKSESDKNNKALITTNNPSATGVIDEGEESREAVVDEKALQQRLEEIENTLKESFEKVNQGICDKITEFIDERVHADRLSLLREKKQAQNKLFAAKEVSELYRRSYDQQHRYRKQEEVRVLNESWSRKYHEDTRELKDKIEHLEFQVRLTSNKLRESSSAMVTVQEVLKEREESIKELTLKLEMANKRSKAHPVRPAVNHSQPHYPPSMPGEQQRWNANHHVVGVKTNTAISQSQHSKDSNGDGNGNHGNGNGNGNHSNGDGNNEGNARTGSNEQPSTSMVTKPVVLANEGQEETYHADSGLQQLASTLKEAQEMVAQGTAGGDTDGDGNGDEKEKEEKEEMESEDHRAILTVDATVQTNLPASPAMLPASTSYDQYDNGNDNDNTPQQQEESEELMEMRETCATLRAEVKTLRQKLVTEVESNRSIASNEQLSTGMGPGSVGNMSPLSTSRSPRVHSPLQSRKAVKESLELLVDAQDGGNSAMANGNTGTSNRGSEYREGDAIDGDVFTLKTSPTSVEQQLSPNEMAQAGNAAPSTTHPPSSQEGSNHNNASSDTLLSPDPTLDPRAHSHIDMHSLDLLSHDDGLDAKTTTSENIIRELNSNSIELTAGIPLTGGGMLGVNLKYAEEIQSLDSHQNAGARGLERFTPDSASGRRIQRLLEEASKRERELTEKLLSYDLQNNELGNNIRKKDAEREQSEKMHSLQMLERGILLKELSQQVQDLRKAMSSIEREKSRKDVQIASLVKVIKVQARQGGGIPEGVGNRVGTLEAAEILASQEMRDFTGKRSAELRASGSRGSLALSRVKVHDSLTHKDEFKPASAISTGPGSALVVDPTQSTSRLLENSKSMPVLSDEYGPYASTGKGVRDVYINQISGTSGRLSPLYGTASTSFTADLGLENTAVVEREVRSRSPTRALHSRGGLSPIPGEPPRHPSSGQAHKEALLAQEQRERDILSGVDKEKEKRDIGKKEEEERYSKLRSVRSQIVGMLSERYPSAEKRSQQILAGDRAKQRALEGRALALKNKVVPKKIYL